MEKSDLKWTKVHESTRPMNKEELDQLPAPMQDLMKHLNAVAEETKGQGKKIDELMEIARKRVAEEKK